MGKIWVYIAPVVVPDGAGATGLMSDTLTAALSTMVVNRIAGALPADKYTTAATDKPIKITSGYNAIKIAAELTLKVETQGSKMTVGCTLKTVWEAIRAPSTAAGNLLGSAAKGAAAENRGTGEAGVIKIAPDALDPVVAPLVTLMLNNPNYTSYGKKLGLPL
ncbi:MAG: hypothetical protein SGJ19_20480 [Planctomycetia bacterium]|nr:hypothetical protein [Planctomycetia bacterium]